MVSGMAARRTKKLSDRIRNLIDDSGMSRYEIWKRCGVDQATLCRFMQGGGIKSESLDKLADLLSWDITVTGKRRHGR